MRTDVPSEREERAETDSVDRMWTARAALQMSSSRPISRQQLELHPLMRIEPASVSGSVPVGAARWKVRASCR